MTRSQRATRKRCWGLTFGMFVTIVIVLADRTVSASVAHGPETRVCAILAATATATAVEHESGEAAGHVGGLRPPNTAIASGSCVATEAGSAVNVSTDGYSADDPSAMGRLFG
jgi:hypothetical protein